MPPYPENTCQNCVTCGVRVHIVCVCVCVCVHSVLLGKHILHRGCHILPSLPIIMPIQHELQFNTHSYGLHFLRFQDCQCLQKPSVAEGKEPQAHVNIGMEVRKWLCLLWVVLECKCIRFKVESTRLLPHLCCHVIWTPSGARLATLRMHTSLRRHTCFSGHR